MLDEICKTGEAMQWPAGMRLVRERWLYMTGANLQYISCYLFCLRLFKQARDGNSLGTVFRISVTIYARRLRWRKTNLKERREERGIDRGGIDGTGIKSRVNYCMIGPH